MNAIECKGLRKEYPGKLAVKGLELAVAEGEFFSLLGVNGAGKTTAIRMLTCLTRPSAGDATLMGHSVVTDAAGVREVTGLSPQETAVAGNLTVRENLLLMAELYGTPRAVALKKTEEMLEHTGLAEVADRRAKVLSGGWQRRLSVAMALISEPKVLFLDEPTLGLDILARRELWKLIRSLRGKITLMLTTHYLEEAEALSDRIGIMKNGELIAVGTVAELNARAGTESFEETFVRLCTGEEADR